MVKAILILPFWICLGQRDWVPSYVLQERFFCRKGSQGHDILWGRGRKGSYVLPCYLCHVSPSCHITLLMCINATPFEANSYLFR